MKKLLIKVVIGVLAVLVLAVVISIFYLGAIVKKQVERVGPTITKTDVKVSVVTVSLLSGHAKFSGLVVGNPEGYKTESAIKMSSLSASIQPSSVFSQKIVVKSVNVEGPEITFEGGLSGNNLKKLLDNVEASSGGEKTTPEPGAKASPKKFQVDEFILSGGKIHLILTDLEGRSTTVPLPDIRLTDLGKDTDGITSAELSKKILRAILENATKTAAAAIADVGKDALRKKAGEATEKAAKGVSDLFKKKP